MSNNYGCAIARSAEAKESGIKMGEPWHLARQRPEGRAAFWRSSNYPLYADMSRRMYEVLLRHTPAIEPYSIDEMFIDLTGLPHLREVAGHIRDEVRRMAKIPTCIGIGPTKTIAKFANRMAKKDFIYRGICGLQNPAERRALYAETPIGEVWGIASKTAEKLRLGGVETIAEFIALPPLAVREAFTVVGARIHAELRGVSCLPLSLRSASKKGVTVSRSFGKMVKNWADRREAMATFASRAGE